MTSDTHEEKTFESIVGKGENSGNTLKDKFSILVPFSLWSAAAPSMGRAKNFVFW